MPAADGGHDRFKRSPRLRKFSLEKKSLTMGVVVKFMAIGGDAAMPKQSIEAERDELQ